ncbi:hypothetical protein JAU75_19100 [Ochrobactrum sp. Q0168]|uniref:hypothetical protein n=1 Tax=Ochrobactrum sp. Q0168 TaxID=2793241 RepID=UPI0018EC893C|nr:hypothetical protein [Ochrobactrum sp. Q0168]
MASKYFIYLAGSDRIKKTDFQARYLHAARRIANSDSCGGGVIVNIVEDTPEGVPYRPLETQSDLVDPYCDVIVEIYPPVDRAEDVLASFVTCMDDIATTEIYQVEEMVQLDRQTAIKGQRSPGMKYIGRLNFHPDLPESAARRSWDIHVPLALRVHVGMDKYVRNWIVDDSRGRPADGIAELNFPTFEDMLKRYFDSERGREEILHDISHFIAHGTRYFVSEFILR